MSKPEWLAVVLTSMPSIWIVYACTYWCANRRIPPVQGRASSFSIASDLLLMGVALIFMGPALVLFALLIAPIESKDVVPALCIAVFLGGFAPVTGAGLLLNRTRVDDAGLKGYGIWGLPAYREWSQINEIVFSTGGQSLRFKGGRRALSVLVRLQSWSIFVQEIERRLPHVPLPIELKQGHQLRNKSDQLAEEGHWQGLYDIAGRVFLIAAMEVAVSLPILGLISSAVLWSVLVGVGLACQPVLRRLVRKPQGFAKVFYGGLYCLGPIAVFLGMMRAHGEITKALGGEDAMTGIQWLFSIAQVFGCSTLVMATLILLARWYLPDRYARQRMSDAIS